MWMPLHMVSQAYVVLFKKEPTAALYLPLLNFTTLELIGFVYEFKINSWSLAVAYQSSRHFVSSLCITQLFFLFFLVFTLQTKHFN